MTAAVTRELQIVYGSLTMGGTTDYLIDGKVTQRHESSVEGGSQVTVTWNVLVSGSTAALLKSAASALEAEFQKRFLNLSVTMGGQTFLSYSHSANTGFNGAPHLEKLDHVATTGRSRMYRCSVTFQLPASDNSGRRYSSTSLHKDASNRAVVTISGQYTAEGGSSARENYDSSIAAFQASVISGLGSNLELVEEEATEDDQDKLLTFRRVLRQILYDQSAAGKDHASVKDHDVVFRMVNPAPGDAVASAGAARRLKIIDVTYTCSVDSEVTTDLATLWTGTLRDYVLSQANALWPGAVAIVSEDPVYNKTQNTITATLRLHISTSGTILEYQVTQQFTRRPNLVTVGKWNGNPRAYYVYPGHAGIERNTIAVMLSRGTTRLERVQGASYAQGSVDRSGNAGGRGGIGPQTGWIILEDVTSKRPLRYGLADLGRTMDVVETTRRITEMWVEAGGEESVSTPGSGGNDAEAPSPGTEITPGENAPPPAPPTPPSPQPPNIPAPDDVLGPILPGDAFAGVEY